MYYKIHTGVFFLWLHQTSQLQHIIVCQINVRYINHHKLLAFSSCFFFIILKSSHTYVFPKSKINQLSVSLFEVVALQFFSYSEHFLVGEAQSITYTHFPHYIVLISFSQSPHTYPRIVLEIHSYAIHSHIRMVRNIKYWLLFYETK